jgi:hypothetical protein
VKACIALLAIFAVTQVMMNAFNVPEANQSSVALDVMVISGVATSLMGLSVLKDWPWQR